MVPTTHAFITLGAEPKGPTGGFREAARSPYWRRDVSQQEFRWGWFGQAGRLCLHIIFMSSLFLEGSVGAGRRPPVAWETSAYSYLNLHGPGPLQRWASGSARTWRFFRETTPAKMLALPASQPAGVAL